MEHQPLLSSERVGFSNSSPSLTQPDPVDSGHSSFISSLSSTWNEMAHRPRQGARWPDCLPRLSRRLKRSMKCVKPFCCTFYFFAAPNSSDDDEGEGGNEDDPADGREASLHERATMTQGRLNKSTHTGQTTEDQSPAPFISATPSHHRRYGPPRSRSADGRAASYALNAPIDGQAGSPTNISAAAAAAAAAGVTSPQAARVPMTDSPCQSSSQTSGTSFKSKTELTSATNQWIMQRGVLVRCGSDGTAVPVQGWTDPTSGPSEGGCSPPAGLRDSYSGSSHVTPSAHSHLLPVSQTTYDGVASGGRGTITGGAASLLEALEAQRRPLSTMDDIRDATSALAALIPIRVEVDVDLNSSRPIGNGDAVIAYCLHVLGPLQPCTTANALNLLEDLLLDDTEGGPLRCTAIHCADLDFRETGLLMGDGRGGLRSATDTSVFQSNNFLDLMGSPIPASFEGKRGDGAASRLECGRRVLTFLRNLVEVQVTSLTTLHFTRCFFSPHSMGHALPLPLASLHRLYFEGCALTPAHVEALIYFARQSDVIQADQYGASFNTSRPVHKSFAVLEELQLSGPLTQESVLELLSFLEGQQELQDREVKLRLVRLPMTLVRCALHHPFIKGNASLIKVSER